MIPKKRLKWMILIQSKPHFGNGSDSVGYKVSRMFYSIAPNHCGLSLGSFRAHSFPQEIISKNTTNLIEKMTQIRYTL